MNRGQMEIMGLAVIVILVTLGVLWAITSISDEAPELEKEFEQTSIAGNFLNTFLNMDTPCADSTVRELMRDCAQRKRIRCDDPYGELREVNSCEYVNETLALVLNATLDDRAQRYRLESSLEEIGAVRDCTEYDEQIQTKQVIPPPRLRLDVTFSVCG